MALIPSLFGTVDPLFNDFWGMTVRPPATGAGSSSLTAFMSPFNASAMRCDLVEVRERHILTYCVCECECV